MLRIRKEGKEKSTRGKKSRGKKNKGKSGRKERKKKKERKGMKRKKVCNSFNCHILYQLFSSGVITAKLNFWENFTVSSRSSSLLSQ